MDKYKITKQELKERISDLEVRLESNLAADAKMTAAKIEKELEILYLALFALENGA